MAKQSYDINFPPLNDMINDTFIPLWDNKDRYLVMYGSRGSSKSDFIATLIVIKMLTDSYFKGIAIRKTFDSIRDSSYGNILKIIDRYNLSALFNCTKVPLEINCVNGNKLLFRGLDDVNKLKSIADPNFAWYEEDIPETEEMWTTISTTLRSTKAPYIQEVFTINPVIEDYEDHWFYQKFFAEHNAESTDLSFRKAITFTNELGRVFTQWATIHHSTYRHNKWLDINAVTKIELLAKSNPYLYQVYNLGVWANKSIEGRFFSSFDITRNTEKKIYNSSLPLHCSFDFNVRPFSACTVYQIDGKKIYLIDEICVKKTNDTDIPIKATCQTLRRKYRTHTEGIYVYGDCNGRKEDTRNEKGYNDFSIIMEELKVFKPQLRVPLSNPPVKTSGEFINDIFMNKYGGIEIFINADCKNVINDLLYLKIDEDGGIAKQMTKGEDSVKFEKYGHASDTMRYFVCAIFNKHFSSFREPASTFGGVFGGKRKSKYTW